MAILGATGVKNHDFQAKIGYFDIFWGIFGDIWSKNGRKPWLGRFCRVRFDPTQPLKVI